MKKWITILMILLGYSLCNSAPADFKVVQGNIYGQTLRLRPPDRTNWLQLLLGSDITADRTLTIYTGDASRTFTLSGNPTLADWFDQNVKSTASPTHPTVILSNLTDGFIPSHSTGVGLIDSLISSTTQIDIFGVSTTGSSLRLREGPVSGVKYIGLKAPDAITNSVTYTLPEVGTAGYCLSLSTTGGVLAWVSCGGAGSMTNPMTAAGDMIYGGTAGAPTALAIGSTGQVLTISAGIPAWQTPTSGMTVPGSDQDIIVNASGVLGADTGVFFYDYTNHKLYLATVVTGGYTPISIGNISSGTGSYTKFQFTNDEAADAFSIRVNSSTYTSHGGTTYFESKTAGGDLIWRSGGYDYARFIGGDLRLGSSTSAIDGYYGLNLYGGGFGSMSYIDINTSMDSNSYPPQINFNKRRSTNPYFSQSGDILGAIYYNGYASGFTPSSKIQAVADGTFTSSSIPSYLSLYTTPAASLTPVERVRLTSDGKISFPPYPTVYYSWPYSLGSGGYLKVSATGAITLDSGSTGIGGSGGAGQFGYFTATTTLASTNAHFYYVCTGVAATDTSAIQALLDGLPANGKVVELSGGTCSINSTLTMGNGGGTGASTRNGITLKGVGQGGTVYGSGTDTGATIIQWNGSSGGTALQVSSCDGCKIQDLSIDGNNLASTLIDSLYGIHLRVSNVIGYKWQGGYAVKIRTVHTGGYGPGSLFQTWDHVTMFEPYGTTANGVDIAPSGSDNVSELTFDSCQFFRSSDNAAIGLRLGHVDHITFNRTYFNRATGTTGIAIQVEPLSIDYTHLNNITFIASPIIGGIKNIGTWSNAAESALIFYPYYTADSQQVPPYDYSGAYTLPSSLVSGITDKGEVLGYRKNLAELTASPSSHTLTPKRSTVVLTGTNAINSISFDSPLDTSLMGYVSAELILIVQVGHGPIALGQSAGNILGGPISMTAGNAYKLVYTGSTVGTGKWSVVK